MLPGPRVVQKDSIARREETLIETVQFVLPAEETLFGDRVVPDDHTTGYAFVGFPRQVRHEVFEAGDLVVVQGALDVQEPALRNKVC